MHVNKNTIRKHISLIQNQIESLVINLNHSSNNLRKINIDDIIKLEYEIRDADIYLEYISVRKDYRRNNLFRLLMTKFLKAIDEQKKLPVLLMVYPTDSKDVSEDDLIKIYLKFGFIAYGKDCGNHRILMRRDI